MHLRQWMLACVTTAVAVSGATAPAALAAGEPAEPLNQYVVSGKISGDTLARQGYDLSEAVLPGNKKGFSIVATPAQAQSLRDKGATVIAPFGTARALRAAPSSPLQQPTHGYDVFRPWSLKPAPCPTTCSTPLVPLKTWYDDLAKRNRDIVQKVVYGKSVLGQDLVAYRITDGAGERHPGRPAVLYDAVQHAREWIAAETERRLFDYFLTRQERPRHGDSGLLRNTELWFVPIVNPDGYDYTFRTKGTRLWRKNLRDVNGDGEITNVDGVDPNRNWADQVELRPRGLVRRLQRRDLPRHRRRLGIRGRRAGALRTARIRPSSRSTTTRSPADPVPRGVAGRDASHRRAR